MSVSPPSTPEGEDAGRGKTAVLPLWKKAVFGAVATALGLAFLELISFLILGLPGFDREGTRAVVNESDPHGPRLFLTQKLADRLDEIIGNSVAFNLIRNAVTHPDGELIFRVRPSIGKDPVLNMFTINSLGFRGEEFDLERRAGPRVLVLGDSCAFGWRILDIEKTWARQLERILEEESGGASVINLGQPGYSTYQCALLFNMWFERVKPDYLVIYSGWNDLDASLLTDAQTRTIMSWTMSPRADWIRKLNMCQLIDQSVTRYRIASLSAKAKISENRRRVPKEDAISYLQDMAGRAAAAGCRTIVVVPPFSAERAPGTPTGLGSMVKYRDAIAEALADSARMIAFPEMDYTNPDSPRYFAGEDGYHPNAEGAEIMARRLAREIVSLEKKSVPSPK